MVPDFEKNFEKISKSSKNLQKFKKSPKFHKISKILKNLQNFEKSKKFLKNLQNFKKSPKFQKISKISKNLQNFKKSPDVKQIVKISIENFLKVQKNDFQKIMEIFFGDSLRNSTRKS